MRHAADSKLLPIVNDVQCSAFMPDGIQMTRNVNVTIVTKRHMECGSALLVLQYFLKKHSQFGAPLIRMDVKIKVPDVTLVWIKVDQGKLPRLNKLKRRSDSNKTKKIDVQDFGPGLYPG